MASDHAAAAAAPTAAPAGQASASTSYTMGHAESVTRSHATRTVSNSAGFLIPYLTPTTKLLDLGCGPGTITVGFAAYITEGSITGVDTSETLMTSARTLIPPDITTKIDFQVGDAYALSFPDNTFDVIYTHQVFTHLPKPVRAMREAHRVLKPGGILATREGDTFHWSHPKLHLCTEAIMRMVRSNGGGTQGRNLHGLAAEAGFDRAKMVVGAGATCYASEAERKMWGGIQIDRFGSEGEYRTSTLKSGTTPEMIEVFLQALREWIVDPDGWYALLQTENVYRK